MKLAIDIGNTSITCGLFKYNKIIKKKNFNTLAPPMNICYIDFLHSLKNKNLTKIIISSVDSQLTKAFIENLEYELKYFFFTSKIKILLINHKNSNLKLKVKKPSTVGADRLCNIKAAIKLYKSPLIIVDFGTATTFDVINNKEEFLGGAIAPGVETSAEYLIRNAALLSNTNLEFPNNVVGVNTKENIQSGIMYGAVDQVTGMIHRIQKEKKQIYNVILTGGLAKIISPYLSIKHILDSDLTLKGMIYIDALNI